MRFSSPQRSKSPAATNLVAGGLSLRSPPSHMAGTGQGRRRARSCSGARFADIILNFPIQPRPPLRSRAHRLSVAPRTPWQVLYANPSTYKRHPGGFRYLLVELRSEPPRGPRGGHHVRSAGSRAVRNEDRRTVRRGPVGPCRSIFHLKFARLACPHSCIMIMVYIPSSWQRSSNRYDRRTSISGKRRTSHEPLHLAVPR